MADADRPAVLEYRKPDLPPAGRRHPLRAVMPFSLTAALACVVTMLTIAVVRSGGSRGEGKQIVTCLWLGTLMFTGAMLIVCVVDVLIRMSMARQPLTPAGAGFCAVAGLVAGIGWALLNTLPELIPDRFAAPRTLLIWWGFPTLLAWISSYWLVRPTPGDRF